MEKLQINCPEGYQIDQDKSNLSEGIVYFKEIKKQLTYDDVAKNLFSKCYYYTAASGNIDKIKSLRTQEYYCSNNAASREQLESLLALNKSINVANYLNDDWIPKTGQTKYFIYLSDEELVIKTHNSVLYGLVYFKTKELAQQAIDILGEEEIKKALTLNHKITI